MRGQQAFALLLLSCGVQLSAGFRHAILAHHNRDQKKREQVDFSFMTSDFSYAGGNGGNWWWGRDNDVNTEIVSGHSCRAKGKDTETFYAASFCYWLPEEAADNSAKIASVGMNWKGGAQTAPLPLCQMNTHATGRGQCLKCSVCHDNAENKDANVSATPFIEEVKLSENCLKESDIKDKCADEDFATCAEKFYDQSCEKECIEAQKSGCGVVEGAAANSWYGAGGVDLTCKPPRPSAILKEDEEQQCARISAHQKPTYAQSVLKTGWLLKRGRDMEWEKRFFVLESGDKVRSAVLHYYTDEPSPTTNFSQWKEISREGKNVVLWDANRVDMKSAADYNFVGVASCFKIYHFYRSYRLCVKGKDKATDHWKEMQATADTRDEWVELIKQTIVYPTSA